MELTTKQRIIDLQRHLTFPWKEAAKTEARQELKQLIAEYGEPVEKFKPKQLSLFEEEAMSTTTLSENA